MRSNSQNTTHYTNEEIDRDFIYKGEQVIKYLGRTGNEELKKEVKSRISSMTEDSEQEISASLIISSYQLISIIYDLLPKQLDIKLSIGV